MNRQPKSNPKDVDHIDIRRAVRLIVISGGFAAIVSAVGYTAANIFLRASSDAPAVAVSAIKSCWTVLIFGPWLVWLGVQGKQLLPSRNVLALLIFAAVIAQVFGNWVFQWSLGVIGLATVVPLTMGSMLISSATLSHFVLGEHVRRESIIAIGLMILAICLLSWGTSSSTNVETSSVVNSSDTIAGTSTEEEGSTNWMTLLATIGACAPGLAYAILAIAIRKSMGESIPLAAPMVVVGVAGAVVLGGVSLVQLSPQEWSRLPSQGLLWMCLAGVANALAFLALSRALKKIPVVFVNAINASQVAMAALAGMWIFGEQLTLPIGIGIVLTVLGFVVLNLAGLDRSWRILRNREDIASDSMPSDGRSENVEQLKKPA